ncbi:hypothetical protein A2690_03550 [Candidatus Roizmanbacteria bacterium RIFCSPHIGHO2_01_FULL_39_12b]|uniref:Mannosyl-glycoprotein endo-beta-N-acetylglucosamidase-like domain-containing protein n=1 Tax=Candidatus Roizmanbacteria bacterium RIFCSPHIGHO2_01_FULL_39_12b TaxID=1802030 RepID=A0A1F7GD99_9BACT|nr:MAG: hypothetical protein A2690_03550 [Candidatus Roizmanbacteria bacterium RIFCSPHIGHO2_01_FULL_39_12b]
MKFNRFLLLLTGFFVVFFLNFSLILSYNASHQRHLAQQRILKEIETVLGPTTNQFALSSAPLVLGAVETQVGLSDARSDNLRTFFKRYSSPLADYAEFIVKISDQYGFYYGLIPAISMAESGGCRVIPEGSHNCYGLGIYGDKVWRFNSYEEGIEALAKILKEKYIDHGLHTPGEIMEKYTPSSNGSWANSVRFFIGKLEQ